MQARCFAVRDHHGIVEQSAQDFFGAAFDLVRSA